MSPEEAEIYVVEYYDENTKRWRRCDNNTTIYEIIETSIKPYRLRRVKS